MAKRRRRARSRKVGRRGLGWLWPAQPCGLSYEKFRSGLTFKDAYDWLAFRKNAEGQSFRPSQKKIVSQMAIMKREMFEQYQKGCAVMERGGPKSKTFADCRRAAGAALPTEGDTSFDFVVLDAPTVVPSGDDDFGYEAPSKYGFKGLRGLGAGGHGGAAANRGKYKPLPPGQGAIDQHRAVELARADIIRAIESGKYELCEKGKRAPAMSPTNPGQHGQRTESENRAVRERLERAGHR